MSAAMLCRKRTSSPPVNKKFRSSSSDNDDLDSAINVLNKLRLEDDDVVKINSDPNMEKSTTAEKENMVLKKKVEVLVRENTILKRAVAIQHKRRRRKEEYDELKAQYEEKIRSLELKNYALTLHLRQATQQDNDSIPAPFNPHIF